jgi:hypothetical protein
VGALAAEDQPPVTDGPPHDSTSEKDKVRPYHAKEASRGQETADVVAAVLKHAAERDQAAKQRMPQKQQPKWMLPLGLNLGVLAVYLLIAPPAWVVVNDFAAPPDEEVVETMRTAMYFATVKIDAFQSQEGRLPGTLGEAGVTGAEAIDYTPRGESYVLISFIGEETVSFDSSAQSAAEWVGDLSRRIGG